MAHKALIVALSVIAAASPASAVQPEPETLMMAPAGGPETEYCLRVEVTGNLVDPVQCWTREQWVDQGVDIDKEWAEEGVAVKG